MIKTRASRGFVAAVYVARFSGYQQLKVIKPESVPVGFRAKQYSKIHIYSFSV